MLQSSECFNRRVFKRILNRQWICELFSLPTGKKMTDTGRQSSLTSFFFGKRKERDDGDKENQPELAEKRHKTDSPARHKQRIRHESERKYEQDFKWLIVTPEGYFCSICQKYNQRPKNGSDVWIVKPCVRRRRQSCKDHLLLVSNIKLIKISVIFYLLL